MCSADNAAKAAAFCRPATPRIADGGEGAGRPRSVKAAREARADFAGFSRPLCRTGRRRVDRFGERAAGAPSLNIVADDGQHHRPFAATLSATSSASRASRAGAIGKCFT
jgi:hypothetical protein